MQNVTDDLQVVKSAGRRVSHHAIHDQFPETFCAMEPLSQQRAAMTLESYQHEFLDSPQLLQNFFSCKAYRNSTTANVSREFCLFSSLRYCQASFTMKPYGHLCRDPSANAWNLGKRTPERFTEHALGHLSQSIMHQIQTLFLATLTIILHRV